ncbi:MAG: hypothetical protein RR382_04245 [Tannerellaceae bacterium]
MNQIYKCLFYILVALMVLLSIMKGIDICVNHHWGFVELGLVTIAIFGCWYGFYCLCFFVAKRITYSYAKVYKEKVIPRIEMEAIERYIAEHPLPEPQVEPIVETDLNKTNEMKNHQISL